MKCLSLTQPWASLMALGAKQIETRSWKTDFRGPVAIHASLNFPAYAREYCLRSDTYDLLYQAGLCRRVAAMRGSILTAGLQVLEMPFGCIIATGRLVDVVRTDYVACDPALCPGEIVRHQPFGMHISQREFAFGNYEDGRFAWIFEDLRALPEPIVAGGAHRLWNYPGLEAPE